MSNQPIIFNIQYTPYSLPKNATDEERERHADERVLRYVGREKYVRVYDDGR